MNRMMIFAAGMLAGTGMTLLGGIATFPGAEAAQEAATTIPARPSAKLKDLRIAPLSKLRCAQGFTGRAQGPGRYGCVRTAAPRCPSGGTATNLRLYRSGNSASGQRLLYDCPASETVKTLCARGHVAGTLSIYRSGNAQGTQRLIYQCVKYRKGN